VKKSIIWPVQAILLSAFFISIPAAMAQGYQTGGNGGNQGQGQYQGQGQGGGQCGGGRRHHHHHHHGQGQGGMGGQNNTIQGQNGAQGHYNGTAPN